MYSEITYSKRAAFISIIPKKKGDTFTAIPAK